MSSSRDVPPNLTASGESRSRILIVDDDAAVRRAVTRALGGADFRIDEASDGRQAVKKADCGAPDLVILDWCMPGFTGLEVMRALRASWRTRLTPILVLTGSGREEDKVLGLVNGADDYIVKPFSVRELRARVESHLSRARERRQASPLTGLPGPASLEGEIARRLRGTKSFSVLHADIDKFKAFNDAHGIARGDDAIRLAATCAQDAARHHGAGDAFVAHIGGDDFAIVIDAERAESAALDLTLRFDACAARFPECTTGAPSLCLSIGISTQAPGVNASVADVCARASKIKNRLKAAVSRRSRYAFADDPAPGRAG